MTELPAEARLWYVPLDEVSRPGDETALAAREDVDHTHVSAYAAGKLFREGVRAGDLLALTDRETVTCLARVLRLDEHTLLGWRKLPVLAYPRLVSSPTLSKVPEHEAAQFQIGVNALLKDVRRPVDVGKTKSPPATNVILFGPPGTGKTYALKRRAVGLVLGEDVARASLADGTLANAWDELRQRGQVVFCTFHQAFAYEEFVEGLRAETDAKGAVRYRMDAGVFKRIALTAAAEGLPPGEGTPVERAEKALQEGARFDFRNARPFVLVIDEINRANMARVFGELITLLEPDKRINGLDAQLVTLPGSKATFGVPPNLHVIGTMNTADRSIALMDVALRRRFAFEEMRPREDVLRRVLTGRGTPEPLRELVVLLFQRLNQRLQLLYDRDHQIGHAYFLGVRSYADLRAVLAERVLPLLQEYFYGQWDKMAVALGYSLNKDGSPKAVRGIDYPRGTVMTARRVGEEDTIGFDHDDYVDQVAWDIHPHFRPADPDGAVEPPTDQWVVEALVEVIYSDTNERAMARTRFTPTDVHPPAR